MQQKNKRNKTRLTKAQIEDKIAERITEEVIKAMDKGKMPWECPWDKSACGLTLPHNITTQKPYRGGNVFSLMWQGGGSVEFASYKQWAELGRKYAVSRGEWEWADKGDGTRWKKPTVYYGVQKGSSSCTATYYHRNPYLKEKETKAKGEDVFGFSFWLKQHSVFARTATNIPAPYPAEEWPEPKPFDACEADLNDAVREYLMSEELDIREGGARAYYSPSGDYIGMPPRHAFTEAGGYIHTLTHEAAHSTGHKTREKREFGFMGDDKYAFEELVAEMTAQILMRTYGIQVKGMPAEDGWDENAIEYLRGWGERFKEKPKEFMRAGRLAQRAVDKILLTEWEEWTDIAIREKAKKGATKNDEEE